MSIGCAETPAGMVLKMLAINANAKITTKAYLPNASPTLFFVIIDIILYSYIKIFQEYIRKS